MSVSRRRFLRSGAMAAVAVGVLKSPVQALASKSQNYFQVPFAAGQNAGFHYARSAFEPYIGEIFKGHDELGMVVKLKLDRVTGYTPNPRTRITTAQPLRTDCFSLSFEASRELPPTSTTYAIEHPKLGTFSLFLKRADVKGQIYYEAVIHRLV